MSTLSNDTLLRLADYLEGRMGFHFPRKKWGELERHVMAVLPDFNFSDPTAFVDWLLSSSPTQKQIEILAGHLTVGETYFFRERKTFETLEYSILPDLIGAHRRTGKRLRFWSAGCSTGEEPYSIAILLDTLIPDLKDWNVTILATDINTVALRKAGEGIYSDWSFRDAPPFFKDKYFEKVNGNHYRLLPGIRRMVTFSYLNLSEDVYPGLQTNTNAMDFIFCRNVLMYFAPEYIKRAVDRFYRSLVDGGQLIVSPVETSQIHYAQYATVHLQDSTFYKKDTSKIKPERKTAQQVEIPYLLPPKKVKHRKLEKLSHTSPPTPLEEAAILYRKGFYREAEERLSPLISNGSSSQEMLVLFTKILANQGKLEDAFRCCEKAASADKCNPHLHYLLAIILTEQKKVEEARASLKKTLYLDHNFVLAHFALANLSLRLGKIAEARKHFDNTTGILSKCKPDEILPESEGITAGRLLEMIGAVRLEEM